MTTPEFGKELRRPFPVHENCYDCAEFYGPGHGVPGCNAWPASKDFACLDFLRLPDVGVNGQTGQEIPPSRMGGRREPRIRSAASTPTRVQVQPKNPPIPPAINAPPRDPSTGQPQKQTRQQSPAANPGPCGERLCGCGAPLRKRQRCCEICRLRRREETIRRRRSRERPSAAVSDVSGVPSTGPGTLSTPCGSGAHN